MGFGKNEYKNAHRRVVQTRGRANQYKCSGQGCNNSAVSWALILERAKQVQYADVFDKRRNRVCAVPFTANVQDYEPLCHPCHVRLDRYGVDVLNDNALYVPPKQRTRQILVVCQKSDYKVRMTRKWIEDEGTPTCPCHGLQMVLG